MSFSKMQWLFPVAVTLHNGEEALFMPSWDLNHKSQLPLHPSAAAIWAALLVLTAAAYVITALSAKRGPQSTPAYLLFGSITAMLLNVFLPHIPAAIVFKGYAPGVITAVLINLPLMSILLFLALREHWVSGIKAALHSVLVPLALASSIAAFFAVA
jgi:hypothetical protein